MSWRLRVRDKFQAAHFLKGYRGRCDKVHGHSFQVEVAVDVTELDRTGIGIDFTRLKAKLAEILPDHTPSTMSTRSTRRPRTSPASSSAG